MSVEPLPWELEHGARPRRLGRRVLRRDRPHRRRRTADADERQVEAALRPSGLDEFIGQTRVRDQLGLVLEAARRRGTRRPTTCCSPGPPGLGKTTLAMIIAAEIEQPLRITSGPAIQHAGDLAAILSVARRGRGALHRRDPPDVAARPRRCSTSRWRTSGSTSSSARARARPRSRSSSPPFTAGRRHHPGRAAARRRCATGSASPRHLEFYDAAELGPIVHRSAGLLGVERRRRRRRRDRARARAAPRASPTGCCAGCATTPRCTADGIVTRDGGPRGARRSSTSTSAASTASTAPSSTRCAGASAAGRSGLSTLAVAVGEEPDTVEDGRRALPRARRFHGAHASGARCLRPRLGAPRADPTRRRVVAVDRHAAHRRGRGRPILGSVPPASGPSKLTKT